MRHIALLNLDYLKLINKAIGRCTTQEHVTTELVPLLKEAISNQVSLTGISLVHVFDWLPSNLDLNQLKKMGAITEIAELSSTSAIVTNHFDTHPHYRLVSKLLSTGIQRVLGSWKKSTLAHDDATKQLDQDAVDQILIAWKNNRLQKELQETLNLTLKESAIHMVNQWLDGETNSEIDNEFTSFTALSLITHFDQDTNRSNLYHQIIANEKCLLLEALKSHTLDLDYRDQIMSEVKSKIILDMAGAVYDNNAEFSTIILDMRRQSGKIRISDATIVEQCIAHWLNKVDNAVTKEIDRVILLKLHADLTNGTVSEHTAEEIKRQAIYMLIDQVKSKKLNTSFHETLQKTITSHLVSDLVQTEGAATIASQSTLMQEIAADTLAQWKAETLSEESIDTLTAILNRELNQSYHQLHQHVYLHEQVNGLKTENQQLREILTRITQQLNIDCEATNRTRITLFN